MIFLKSAFPICIVFLNTTLERRRISLQTRGPRPSQSCTRPVNGCGVVPCCNYVSFVFSSGLIGLLLKSALSIWGGILKHNCAMAGDFVVDSVSASFSAVYTVREWWRGCSALYLGLSGIFLRFVSIYLPVSVPMVIRFRTSVGFKWPQPSVCNCPDRPTIDVHRPIDR